MSINPISAYDAGKVAGAVEEQLRIIKLLKKNAEPMRSEGLGWMPYDDAVDLELAIELIKGDATSKDSFTVELEGENK